MKRIWRTLLWCCLLPLILWGCAEDTAVLPREGFDYHMTEGMLLGYPIPVSKENDWCLTGEEQGSVWLYEPANGTYRPGHNGILMTLLEGKNMAIAYGMWQGRAVYFHAKGEGYTVFEGSYGGGALVHMDTGALYAVAAEKTLTLTERCTGVWDLYEDTVLYQTGEGLYRQRAGEEAVCITTQSAADGWLVRANTETVLFSAPDGWYRCDVGADPVSCVIPGGEGVPIFAHGTEYLLFGEDGSFYLYHTLTGEKTDMDMGGLYRFPETWGCSDKLPLSPDGKYIYFYDLDHIYRLAPGTGALDIADNEAPVYEGMCVLSSMTAVDAECVLLSQGADERTEFVAVITRALFGEDIPETVPDEKIDLTPDTEEAPEDTGL